MDGGGANPDQRFSCPPMRASQRLEREDVCGAVKTSWGAWPAWWSWPGPGFDINAAHLHVASIRRKVCAFYWIGWQAADLAEANPSMPIRPTSLGRSGWLAAALEDRRSGGARGPLDAPSSRGVGVRRCRSYNTWPTGRDHRRARWIVVSESPCGDRRRLEAGCGNGRLSPIGPCYATPGPPWRFSLAAEHRAGHAPHSSMHLGCLRGGGFLHWSRPIPRLERPSTATFYGLHPAGDSIFPIEAQDYARWPPFPAPASRRFVFPFERAEAAGDRVPLRRVHAFSFGLELHP